MNSVLSVVHATWELLVDACVYMILGLVIGGLMRVALSPSQVAKHLGKGRFWPVFKAALVGVPLPLCSCGVVPAAATLRKQGANRGAVTAFLIATPESGVDSIAVTYALIDPIMTVARPVVAFVSALGAGLAQQVLFPEKQRETAPPDLSCPIDGCCDGVDCPPNVHRRHHRIHERVRGGVRFAFGELWNDLVGWFWIGMVLAGVITVIVPDNFAKAYLGGGLMAMLMMLVISVPMYICATASTVIAASLVVKGVSPGAALVLMLAGPATNVASLTLVTGLLGKRATAVYLGSIAVFSVLAGLVVDSIYNRLGIEASAVIGQASELVPRCVRVVAALVIVGLSVRPLVQWLRGKWVQFAERLNGRAQGASSGGVGRVCHDHCGHDHHDHGRDDSRAHTR